MCTFTVLISLVVSFLELQDHFDDGNGGRKADGFENLLGAVKQSDNADLTSSRASETRTYAVAHDPEVNDTWEGSTFLVAAPLHFLAFVSSASSYLDLGNM